MSNNISDIINSTADKAQYALKDNSVMGEPITIDGTVIIPVYKLSFGFGGGGFDRVSAKDKDSLAGGAGAGVTKKPISYIVMKDGDVSILSADSDQKPDIFSKIIKYISKKKEGKQL